MAVLQSLMEQIKIVTLAADVFFVDKTAFLITLSRKIKFVMTEHVAVRTATSLAKHLNRVIQVNRRAGFVIQTLLMNGEFEKIRDLMPILECNTMQAKELVSKAEHMIWTIKERACGLITTLPFNHIPRRLKIEFIYFFVLWLNAFPARNRVSGIHLLRELLVR